MSGMTRHNNLSTSIYYCIFCTQSNKLCFFWILQEMELILIEAYHCFYHPVP